MKRHVNDNLDFDLSESTVFKLFPDLVLGFGAFECNYADDSQIETNMSVGIFRKDFQHYYSKTGYKTPYFLHQPNPLELDEQV